jgi:hypothetical protein
VCPKILVGVLTKMLISSQGMILDSAQQFAGPEPTLEISGQNIMHKIMGWLFNQHLTLE